MSEPPTRGDGERDPPQGPTYVGPREWPPPEMRWPPPPAARTAPPGADAEVPRERRAPWQALLLCVSIALVAQLGATLVFAAWMHGSPHADELNALDADARLQRIAALPGGLESMILPLQATLAAFALLLAVALPGGVRAGLGLERPRASAAQWLIAVGGTLAAQLAVTHGVIPHFDLPPHLKMLEEGLAQRSVWPAIGFAVVAPALCEELFFRGWLQRRLRVAWGSTVSIVLSGAIFAAYHMEPVHVLGVLPIGLWIAWVADRTRSTWIAIACHAANNGFALLAVRQGWSSG
ncbi:MAG: CPBP family intramembrane metalloprotease [Planctomycetota bacterium]|nr:MAG: CPBP family intramembrane metalloprotease [Planctomycetota bacterium]